MIFKNFCPFKVGDIYLTTSSTNPSSIYLGTTWQKIENRFLLGTSSNGVSKQLGGSNTKTITQANLPAVKIQLNSFSLSRGTMEITGSTGQYFDNRSNPLYSGAFHQGSSGKGTVGNATWNETVVGFTASKAWTGTTSTAQPQTVNLGEGQPLDVTPSYYTCHMWLRLS